MTTEQRFDQVLDQAWDKSLFEVPGVDMRACMCAEHNPFPRPIVDGAWRTRYGNAEWNVWTAMSALGLHEVTEVDEVLREEGERFLAGLEGFTRDGGVWLRPDSRSPFKTAAHELAHNVLGHTALTAKLESSVKRGDPVAIALLAVSHPIGEIEAEMAALLVVDALGYPDGREQTLTSAWSYFMDHVQGGGTFPDRGRVKDAARKILAAGKGVRHARAA